MFQRKEQDKTQEQNPKDMEICIFPNKEFKVMVIKCSLNSGD